jgi:arylsulfatase A-like enzyme
VPDVRSPFLARVEIALAPAAVATAIAAVVSGWRAAVPHEYWQSGLRRLVVLGAVERFDAWAPWAAGAAVLGALVLGLFAWTPRPRRARLAGAFLLGVIFLRVAVAVGAWRAAQGPNLLLISIDTLRADRLGPWGYPLPTSPTLDRRLAGEGVTFLDTWSQSPKTTPSHMTMLTALYPCVHGIGLWWGDRPAHVLNPAAHTLAEVLRNAGFSTAAFTGGAHMDRRRGFDHGFQVYEDKGGGTELGRALSWLKHHRRERFFLFFHTYQIHDPYLPPPDLVREFGDGYQGPILDTMKHLRRGEGPYEEQSKRFWASVDRTRPADVAFIQRLYAAGIRNMDATTLTRLLDALAQWDLERDTLVVFTSDHGEAFDEHGVFLHDDLYRGTLHVPLVMRFPGHLPAGKRIEARARLVDLMPTVLDLLGVPASAGMQGRSLVPFVHDDATGRDAPSEYDDSPRAHPFESLRAGPYSYILEGTREQLFDLGADPGETTDLAAGQPETLVTFRTARATRLDECKRLAAVYGPTGGDVMPTDERVRQLRALGYVE